MGGEGGGRGGVAGAAGWSGGAGRGEQRAADLGGVEEWRDGAVECFCGEFLGSAVPTRLVSGRGEGGLMDGCADAWGLDTGVHVLRGIAVEDLHDTAGGG